MDETNLSVEIAAKIDQLLSGLDQASAALNNFTNKTSSQFRESASSTKVLGDSMNDLRHTLLGMLDPIRGVYNGVGELAEVFAAAFAVDKIAEFAEKISELGANALHMAAELGLSTEAVTRFEFAAGAMGLEGEAGAQGLLRLERAASQAAGGAKEYARAFDALGVKVTDSNGKLKSMEVLLPEIADRFQATADGPNKTAIAMEIMGRAGAKMIPLLDQGSEGLKAMGKASDDAGTTISGPMAEGMEKTAIQMYTLGQSVEGVAITLYEAFKPAIDVVLDLLVGLVQGFNNNIKSGGQFNGVLTLIVIAVDAVIAVLGACVTGFEVLFNILWIGATALLGPLLTLGKVIADVFSGHWAQAQADARAGLEVIGNIIEDKFKEILKEGQQFHDELGKLFSNIGPNGVDTTGGGKGKPEAPKPDLPPIDDTTTKANKTAQKLADEKLKAAEQEALAEVKIEEDKNNSLFALSQETLAEYVANEKKIADEKYQIEKDYYTKKAEADKGDVVAHQKDLDALKLLEITHKGALLKIDEDAAQKQQALDKEATQKFIQDKQQELGEAIEHENNLYEIGLISSKEKADYERQLTTTVYQQILQRLNAEIAGLKQGTKAYQEAIAQREKLENDFTKAIGKIQDTALKEDLQKWQTFSQSVRSSFNSALNGMILGTETWQQALGNIIDGVANAFLEMGEKMLEDWIEQQIKKQVLDTTTQQETQATTVLSNAEIAASGAMASWSAAPFPVNLAAPEMAAAAFAETMAYAERGAVLDSDRIVQAHAEEMILPAPLSKGIQGLIAGGGGGGSPHLHYSPTVNAPQHRSLEQLLNDESQTMIAWVQARVRDRSLKLNG